ncbi:4265_t:CDS:2, partial [Scutellospora calospora]
MTPIIKYGEFEDLPNKDEYVKSNNTVKLLGDKIITLNSIENNEFNRLELEACIHRNYVIIYFKNSDESAAFKSCEHENVLQVFGLTCENNNYYIVREHANNGNLRDYLRNTLLSWNEKLILTKQVVEGLKALHDNGIVHSEL